MKSLESPIVSAAKDINPLKMNILVFYENYHVALESELASHCDIRGVLHKIFTTIKSTFGKFI